MAQAQLYGIKNCDTMKKAFKWLDQHNIAYEFHDYKKIVPDRAILKLAIQQYDWETVINRRGTTWRKLPEDVQTQMDGTKAVNIALENPSIIKRPLLVFDNVIHLGFKANEYEAIFA